MSDYEIKKLTVHEFHLLLPLMQDCFGMNVNIAYFEWKFKDNPAGFVEGYMAIHSSGEVAAYYGVIPEWYFLEGKKQVIYQSCDTMTHSKHRRKGLFQLLAQHCYDQLQKQEKLFVIGFGGGQSTPGFLKFGWQEAFKMRYFFYPTVLSYLHSAKAHGIHEISDVTEIEHLAEASNRNALIRSDKQGEVLKWRLNNPLHEYLTIGLRNGEGRLVGYLIYYVEKDKIIVFDFFAEDKSSEKKLFSYLKGQLRQFKKVKGLVGFVQENSLYAKSLQKNKFISNPFNKGPLSVKTPFIFYSTAERMNRYQLPGCWQVGSFEHDSL